MAMVEEEDMMGVSRGGLMVEVSDYARLDFVLVPTSAIEGPMTDRPLRACH